MVETIFEFLKSGPIRRTARETHLDAGQAIGRAIDGRTALRAQVTSPNQFEGLARG